MSVVGQWPPHSKLTTNIFRSTFDSRPKQHTKSPNERAAVQTTGIEKAMTLSARVVRGDTKSCEGHSKDLHTPP